MPIEPLELRWRVLLAYAFNADYRRGDLVYAGDSVLPVEGQSGHLEPRTGGAQAVIIKVIRSKDPFARVPRAVLDDKRLSWRAKGILAYLLSKPSDWTVRMRDVLSHAPEGRDAVRAAFRELKQYGYAKLLPSNGGPNGGSQWVVSDTPQGGVCPENPSPENPSPENPPLSKKERTKKKISCASHNEVVPVPLLLNTPAFHKAWDDWCLHRRQGGKKLTAISQERQLKKLEAMGEQRAIAAINFSIQQGYQGIYEENTNARNQRPATRSRGKYFDGRFNEGEPSRYADAARKA